jgi:hypothetical protein
MQNFGRPNIRWSESIKLCGRIPGWISYQDDPNWHLWVAKGHRYNKGAVPFIKHFQMRTSEKVWTLEQTCKSSVQRKLERRCSITEHNVMSRGNTPQNKLFKIIITHAWNNISCAVFKTIFSSSSSSICHAVWPRVDPFRSHVSWSLFKGLPWFLLPVGE